MSILPSKITLLCAAGLFAAAYSSLAAVVLNTNALTNGGFEMEGTTPADAAYWIESSVSATIKVEFLDADFGVTGSFDNSFFKRCYWSKGCLGTKPSVDWCNSGKHILG